MPRNRTVRRLLVSALLAVGTLAVPDLAAADPPDGSFSGGAIAEERQLSGSDDGRGQGDADDERPRADASPAPSTPARVVFPVRGRYTFGATGGTFGSPRGRRLHQGQDVMAACGTPLVAAASGVISHNTFQGLAGNYVVVNGKAADFVYMHLSARSPLAVGTPIRAGQALGTVGATGNARGCHLHFEIWTEPGYRRGGQPVDPLPALRGR